MLNRLVHCASSEKYVCVQCQRTFNEWKNFQRHGKEVHSNIGRFSCSFCSLKTKRRHDLERHNNRKHKCRTIVALLLDDLVTEISEVQTEIVVLNSRSEGVISDILDEIVENLDFRPATDDMDLPDSTPSSSEAWEICQCEYDKIRLRNIAECRAALRSIFPNPDEFKILKVKKVRKVKQLCHYL